MKCPDLWPCAAARDLPPATAAPKHPLCAVDAILLQLLQQTSPNLPGKQKLLHFVQQNFVKRSFGPQTPESIARNTAECDLMLNIEFSIV